MVGGLFPDWQSQSGQHLVQLLALQGAGVEAAELEVELNERVRVYRLFDLTAAEIALIEENLGRRAAR